MSAESQYAAWLIDQPRSVSPQLLMRITPRPTAAMAGGEASIVTQCSEI